MEKDAFYFPHFCNARHDRKIKRLRKELGLEGYGIFFMLLETLREQTDFKYPIEDFDLLADEFGTSEQKVRTVVCNYGLFQVDQKEKFFSTKMIFYLQPYLESKENNRISGIKGNLIKNKYLPKSDFDFLNNDDIVEINNIVNSGGDRGAIRGAIANKVKEIKESKGKYIESKEIFKNQKEITDWFTRYKGYPNPSLGDIEYIQNLIDKYDLEKVKQSFRFCFVEKKWNALDNVEKKILNPNMGIDKDNSQIDKKSILGDY